MNVLLVFRDFSGAPFSEAADWPAAEDPRQPIDSGHHQRHVSDRLRVCFFLVLQPGFTGFFEPGSAAVSFQTTAGFFFRCVMRVIRKNAINNTVFFLLFFLLLSFFFVGLAPATRFPCRRNGEDLRTPPRASNFVRTGAAK